MKRVGYDPLALKQMLLVMDRKLGPKSGGFGKTHPKPADRIKSVEPLIGDHDRVVSPAPRAARFKKAMASI
jgi:predicted Zn-dependent protease